MKLSISMITPVRNGVQTVGETLDSVMLQSYGCLEHIVFDAKSNDGTSELIQARKQKNLLHICESDAGLYDAMNRGIGIASGDIIGIINADDYLLPEALSIVSQAFAEEEIDFAYGSVQKIGKDGTNLGVFPVREDWVAGAKLWHGRDWRYLVPFSHPGLFVRRDTYRRLGGFDLSYRLAADHEFMCRLIATAARGKRIPHALAAFRLGGISAVGAEIFAEDERIAIKYGLHPALARLNRWRSTVGRRVRIAFN